ncbi:sigma-70 family RNA polymerase sigma factor [Clostridium cylindrosporum]|uniref:RNA polymerase, sigma-24 subunit, ECF subfamily n=1 Tax=Clostridium cylindrosporum DSM 605 TaxID=1121307 RepID=A0A0J8FYW2_CLOCY|nr:sigma-70 family RNA polymerase sigma factor [Clostridium cylindrosporum]KMT20806.1 RNA polymerase, sigma-24 subunit, ECF subfamily [Clostridium cylindrosporum DSM 605]
MNIDSNNFINELKRKNEKALNYLYEKYLGLAYKIAFDNLRDIGTKEDVEECVSDIFVGVWNNIDKYSEEITSFKTWFSAVSRYKAIDYKRKLKSKDVNVELDENELVEELTIEDKIVIAEDVDSLRKIIDSMGDVDRQIFIKRYILNEKIEDISKALGIARSVIDNRLSRGRREIKNKWLEITGRQCYEEK